MVRIVPKIAKKAGLPPGSLVHVGNKKEGSVAIELIDYTENHLHEKKSVKHVEECFPFKKKSSVTWINVMGLHEVDIIEKIGKQFDVHHLILEDILHTGQRPKFEDFGKYLFLVLQMIYFKNHKGKKELISEQVSFIVSNNYVITFQEDIEGDVFNVVRERLRSNKGRIRKMGNDYLAYSLIDAIVDNYFVVLEEMGNDIELLEEELLKNPTPKTMDKINEIKRQLLLIRRSIWPLREIINTLSREGSKIIRKQTMIYFRDVYDHTIQVMDTVETFREVVSGTLDIYLSSISNKMNEVMKVLTVIATIFIPLTFVTGIYGMNFEYMPELKWKGAYFVVISTLIFIGGVMMYYFRKKNWI